jgi:DNA-directed RNA polymerase I subunit RPA43
MGRYVPQMNGVLLAHWEHELLDDTVNIINECPFGVCEVQFYSILWAPKIGQKLCKLPRPSFDSKAEQSDGTHSLSSPSHISLLFSKTFNISIPLQHIPTDTLEFEHTAPEDDADLDSDDELDLNDSGVEEVGRWKRKSDGKLLGEGGKAVKFTVIG